MTRFYLTLLRSAVLTGVAALVATPALAQTEVLATRHGVAVSASYTGATVRASSGSEAAGVGGLALDATFGRISVGVAGAFAGERTDLAVGAGVHLVRDLAALRTVTFGATVQTLDLTDLWVVTPSFSASGRVVQTGGVSLVPSGTLGLAVPFDIGSSSGGLTPDVVAAAGLGLVVGQGPTRLLVRPQVAWSPTADAPAALGVAVGLARGWQ